MIFRSTRLGQFSIDSIDSIDQLRGLCGVDDRDWAGARDVTEMMQQDSSEIQILSVSKIQQSYLLFEQTQLYQLIARCSRSSLNRAWRLVATMKDDEVHMRSEEDQATYLHHIVNQVRTSFL